MTRSFSCFKRLAALLVPAFALAMVPGCAPEFSDVASANYENTETPGTPKNVTAKALSDHSIKITWDPVQGCTNYKVFWSDEADGDYQIITGYSKNLLHDTWYVDDYEGQGLEPGTDNYYKVSAYSNNKFFRTSPMSQAAHATTLAEGAAPVEEVFLDPPATIYANASSPTSIGLSWTSVEGAVGYNVYSSNAEDGDYTFRFYHAQYSSPFWNDNGLQPGETRYYRIATVSADGEGEKSGPYSATTQTESSVPDTPTGVTATADGTTITITWNTVYGAASYEVYRSSSESGTYASLGSAYSTSYTDMDLTAVATYWYKVDARNGYGASSRSSAASATTGGSGTSGSPGSQAAMAITLYSSEHNWTDGAVTADSPEVWYRFYIPDDDTYCLMGRDRYGYGDPYTGDISFEIYDSGLNWTMSIDAGNGGSFDYPGGILGENYLKSKWSAGWWYVKVIPYGGDSANYGTFAISFY
ncbi:MAG: hypothetical protein LBL31_00720 [Spirochaetaceae bacterium]|jgi:fibronectin type 3 domain-containing protein|nr:hypothetical protein [Spirochaetaceae bacterium]